MDCTAILAAWVVAIPLVNMYSKPTTDADVVSQAIYSTTVNERERSGAWVKIRTPDDYTGWVEAASLRDTEYAAKGRTAWVDAVAAHLYREASVTKHAPMMTLPYDSRLEIVAEEEAGGHRWFQVRLVDDRSAWIQHGDLRFDDKPLSIDAMVALSKRFLHLPYTWGGTSSFGFDCSGLTQTLCRRRGILMPRDAGPQARWEGVREIERAELQPGDLLFFGKESKRVTHTGLYIGDGEFIHATAHEVPRIQISRLDTPHWTKLLLGCRRPK